MVEDGIEGYKDLGEEEDWTVEDDVEPEKAVKGSKVDASREESRKGKEAFFLAIFVLALGMPCLQMS